MTFIINAQIGFTEGCFSYGFFHSKEEMIFSWYLELYAHFSQIWWKTPGKMLCVFWFPEHTKY